MSVDVSTRLPLVSAAPGPPADALGDLDYTLGADSAEWSLHLPVSVNDTYGDPFIPEQVANTVAKLRQLDGHRAPIAIFTKAGWNREALDWLEQVRHNDKVVVYYSLTGLDEGGISFAQRVRMIEALGELFRHVVVFTRPIIYGRNTHPGTLRRLVEVARDHGTYLVLGGIHDPHKRKKLPYSVEELLVALCDEAGVKSFHKTSCCAAYLHGVSCWVHDLGAPRNLDVLHELGYRFAVVDERVVLPEGTTGDINFIRMLTRAEVWVERLVSNYNLLTFPSGEHKLEATSSWFAWSKNIEVCLDCNYCIIKQIEYLRKQRVAIGVHPSRILETVEGTAHLHDFAGFRTSKLRDQGDAPHAYADVRTVKPCWVGRYAPLARSATPAGATVR